MSGPIVIFEHPPAYLASGQYLANAARLAANTTNARARPPREEAASVWGSLPAARAGGGRCRRATTPTDIPPTSARRHEPTRWRRPRAARSQRRVWRTRWPMLFWPRSTPTRSPSRSPQQTRSRAAAPALPGRRARRRTCPPRSRSAERAFLACEPENRLVARNLEARWEGRLADLPEPDLAKARIGIAWHTGATDEIVVARGMRVAECRSHRPGSDRARRAAERSRLQDRCRKGLRRRRGGEPPPLSPDPTGEPATQGRGDRLRARAAPPRRPRCRHPVDQAGLARRETWPGPPVVHPLRRQDRKRVSRAGRVLRPPAPARRRRKTRHRAHRRGSRRRSRGKHVRRLPLDRTSPAPGPAGPAGRWFIDLTPEVEAACRERIASSAHLPHPRPSAKDHPALAEGGSMKASSRSSPTARSVLRAGWVRCDGDARGCRGRNAPLGFHLVLPAGCREWRGWPRALPLVLLVTSAFPFGAHLRRRAHRPRAGHGAVLAMQARPSEPQIVMPSAGPRPWGPAQAARGAPGEAPPGRSTGDGD
jgi:hypothetical protein